MAIKPHEFGTHCTTTPQKLAMIEDQVQIVTARFSKQDLKGYCVGLPGAGKQLERHIQEYCDYGIPENRQVMVDYDRNVNKRHIYYKDRLGFKGTVVCGELGKVVNRMWEKGEQIDIIDYDDVGFLEHRHEDLIEKAAQHNVKVIILVFTTRCRKLSPLHQYWKTKLGLEKRYNTISKGWHEPVTLIQAGAVKSLAKQYGFDVTWTSYKGLSPMMRCVLLKK